MGLFQKKYIYVQVCFLHGKHPYTYRTKDRSINVNTVVMVPAGDEVKPAIVTGVREYKEKDVPYPLEKTKEIIGKADRANRKLFKGIDMRMPLDISVKSVQILDGYARVVTDKAERWEMRERYLRRPDIKIIETYPASQGGKVLSRDNGGKRIETTDWMKEEHLWGDVTYRCLSCNGVFRRPEAFCPNCRAEVKRIKNDPVWVDEMEFYD